MKKIFIYFLFFPFIVKAQYKAVGNSLGLTPDIKSLRVTLGPVYPGQPYIYLYQKYQVDSALSTIVSGVSSFNTRTGAVTLTLSDVTTALGYRPYNDTNPAGYIPNINGITAGGDLSGTYPNPTVANFNGQLPAYYLNYNNLTNKPTIYTFTGNSGQYTTGAGGYVTFPTDLMHLDIDESVTGNKLWSGSNYLRVTNAPVNNLDVTRLVDILVGRNAANFGQTASLADVAHLAMPSGSDQTVRVGAWLNLRSVSGTDSVSVKVTWTDNNSVSKTKTFYAQGQPNNRQIGTVDDYPFPTMDLRVLNGTTVQVAAVVTGSGTILYEVGSTIQKLIGDGGL